MYAIIRMGGKQYRVQPGDKVRVEKLEQNLGAEFDWNEILLIGGDKVFVGEPLLKNAKVSVVVTQQSKSPKILVFKKKRRKGYRRMQGHRQFFTELFVKAITSPEGQTAKAESKPHVVDPAVKMERMLKHQESVAKGEKTAKKAAPKKKAAPAKKKAAAPKKKAAGAKAKKAAPKKKAAKK